MDPKQVQEHLLRRHSLRVGDEMADYIARQMKTPDALAIPIIAADARTGLPRALNIPLADLNPEP